MYKAIFCLVTFACIHSASIAQEKNIESQLDKYIAGNFDESQPGYQLIIAKKGQIIYRKNFGKANLELNVPVRNEMVFNLASITKQFTAVAILQLVEQNKLSLHDSLQKFVPDFPSKGYTITIENLLTHTSGIGDYMQINYPALYMERWDFTPKQLIDSFRNYPLEFAPGTKFSYSNSGYFLLGYIIEKISGKRYQDYIRESILKPLDLSNSYFDFGSNIIPNRASGYWKESTGFKNADFWSPTIEYAAGGLISNVDDLFKWHKAVISHSVLKKETLGKALTPFILKDGTSSGYGYGWFLKTTNGIKSIEHAGGMSGFRTNAIYYPDEDIYIAILCNYGNAPMEEISFNISKIVLNKPLQANFKLDRKSMDSFIGEYYLSVDPNRSITISVDKEQLIASFSPTEVIPLMFQTSTRFQFKNLPDVNCEFIIEDGKVIKFVLNQNGIYEWIRK
jgi:CubicO group peptidase (beta-lactamase class C family)